MSNWENRPLRLSQQHYGCLDAYVLVEIMEKLIKMAESSQFAEEYTMHVFTLDTRYEETHADYDSGDYSDEKIKEERKKRIQLTKTPSLTKQGFDDGKNLLTSKSLEPSMWKTRGFVMDKNMINLSYLLRNRGITCIDTTSKFSEENC